MSVTAKPRRHHKAVRASQPSAAALKPVLQAGVVTLLTLLIALSGTGNGFVTLDDPLYIGNQFVVKGLTPAGVVFAFRSVSDLYWHPLTWLSHEFDVSLFGLDPAGHHFTSAALYAISAGLLFLLLRRVGAGAWSSAAAALFWSIHPLRVESFAWAAERKDVLCALFFLATLLAYLSYADQPSRWRYVVWNGLGVLALMSKPSAVCLVPMLILLDHWPLRRTGGAKGVLEKLPLLAMSAVVMWLTIYGQKLSGSMSHLQGVPAGVRVENVAVFYIRYIGKILWPVNLACFYPYGGPPSHPQVMGAALGLLIVTAVAIRMRRSRPWLAVAWAWFLIALLPNIGLLQAGRQSIADRFTHLATIGVSIGVACALSGWAGASKLLRGAATASICAVLGVLAFLSIRQIGYWHDSVRLFDHAVGVEDSDYVRGNLATVLIAQGRYAEAEPHLVVAVHQSPLAADYHSDLANVLLRTGRPAEAQTEAATALSLEPGSISAVETMGLILFQGGDLRRALMQFNRALELGAPSQPIASELNDMAASLASRGNPQGAEPLLRRALDLNPKLVQGWRNLALVLMDQRRADEVTGVLHQAVAATGPQAAYADLMPSAPAR